MGEHPGNRQYLDKISYAFITGLPIYRNVTKCRCQIQGRSRNVTKCIEMYKPDS